MKVLLGWGIAVFAVGVVLGTAAPATAATPAPAATPPAVGRAVPSTPTPIGLTVEASSATYPDGVAPILHVRLTNHSPAACGLAATPDLTLSVVGATRDGRR